MISMHQKCIILLEIIIKDSVDLITGMLLKHTCGWTIDPPAAKEYAVLPDVVDKISPSPWTHVTNELSQ